MASLILPPKNIVASVNAGSISTATTYSNASSVWNGSPMSYNVVLTIIPLLNSSEDTTPTQYEWNGFDITAGMWLGQPNGACYNIKSVSAQDAVSVTCVIEDVDLYVLLNDITQTGNNAPLEDSNGLVFNISEDGLPIITPTATQIGAIGAASQWLNDLHDRFRDRNYYTTFFSIDPNSTIYPSGSFVLGGFVKLLSNSTFSFINGNS